MAILSGQVGIDNYLVGVRNERNEIFGDSAISQHSPFVGGNDILMGGAGGENVIYGDTAGLYSAYKFGYSLGDHLKWRTTGDYAVEACSVATGNTPQSFRDLLAGRKALLCTTPTVERVYGENLRRVISDASQTSRSLVLWVNETNKALSSVSAVIDAASEFELGRRDLIIVAGGGVCSDIVRTAASLYRRGVPHICIPTTLIGQIDAAIGAKGGINYGGKKNSVGTFHPPLGVFFDTQFLTTLPDFYIREGLAEVLKLAVCMDQPFLDRLVETADTLVDGFRMGSSWTSEIVKRSIELTLMELSKDLFEAGTLERVLDFGHTLSPLLEAQSGFAISHGRAVAIDIAMSSLMSAEIGLIDLKDAQSIVDLAGRMGLPVWSERLSLALVREALQHAKVHRAGAINYVIPARSLGQVEVLKDESLLTDRVIGNALRTLEAKAQANKQLVAPR